MLLLWPAFTGLQHFQPQTHKAFCKLPGLRKRKRKVSACQNQHKDITSWPVQSFLFCWHSQHDCCFLLHCPATSRRLCFLQADKLGAKHQPGWDLRSDLQYLRHGKSPRKVTSLSGFLQRCWSAKGSLPAYRTQPLRQVAQGEDCPGRGVWTAATTSSQSAS